MCKSHLWKDIMAVKIVHFITDVTRVLLLLTFVITITVPAHITDLGFSCVAICRIISSIHNIRSLTILKNLYKSLVSTNLFLRCSTMICRLRHAFTTSASWSEISRALSPEYATINFAASSCTCFT